VGTGTTERYVLASSHPILHGFVVFIVVVGAILYFVPTYVAIARRHHWILRIFIVNLLNLESAAHSPGGAN
jgi:hypothetical protein